MAIVVESQSYAEGDLGSTVSVTKPTGTAEGDLLVAVVSTNLRAPSISGGATWTQRASVVNSGYCRVFTSTAGASEPASYSVDIDEPSDKGGCTIFRISGADTTSPIDVSGTGTGTSATPTAPDITTTVANTLLIAGHSLDGTRLATENAGYPSGYTGGSHEEVVSPGSNVHGAAYKAQAGTGATGTAAFTCDSSDTWSAVHIAIAPASTGEDVSPSNGSINVVGNTASTGVHSTLSPSNAVVDVLGGIHSVETEVKISPANGVIEVAGSSAEVSITGPLSPSNGVIEVVGSTASIGAEYTVIPVSGSVDVIGNAATVNTPVAATSNAKSFFMCATIGGGSVFGGAGGNRCSLGVGGSVEDDNDAHSFIGANCTISDPRAYVAVNNLSTDFDMELYQNDVATGCKVTITASGNPTGWITGSGTVDVAAGDELHWRDAASTGNATLTMLAGVIESDDESAITAFNVNNQSSTNLTGNNSTSYQKACGGREPQSVEADAEMQCPISGTLSHLYVDLGTVSRTSTCSGKIRISNLDGSQEITWLSGSGPTAVDTVNSDSISAREALSYSITNGPGAGEANNIEKMGSTLVNSDGDFLLVCGAGFRADQTDNLTRYYPLSGNLDDGLGTAEAQVAISAPFAFNISELFIRVTDEIMTGDSDLSVHVNGSDVGTGITISGSGGAGYHYQTEDIDVQEGDLVSLKMVTGTGTRLRIGYTGVVARELGATELTSIVGTVNVLGNIATVAAGQESTLSPSTGNVEVLGNSSSVEVEHTLYPANGTVEVVGSSASVNAVASGNVSPSAGIVEVVGNTAQIGGDLVASPSTGAINVSGSTATVQAVDADQDLTAAGNATVNVFGNTHTVTLSSGGFWQADAAAEGSADALWVRAPWNS